MASKLSINLDQRMLLDRLYNLKGEESEILKAIKEKIETNKKDATQLSDESSDLKTQKDNATSLKGKLDSQYAKILEDLKGIARGSYETVLEEASEDFDPEALLSRLQEKIPTRIQEIIEQIAKIDESIQETRRKINENEIESKELEGQLTDAMQMQEKLVKLIKESLQGNGSITRDYVQDLLGKLGFSEEETIELGKMILFPQGTLAEYDQEYQEELNRGKSIQEVFNAATAAAESGSEELEAAPEQSEEPVESSAPEETGNESTVETIEDPEAGVEIEEQTEVEDSFFQETTIANGLFSKDIVEFLKVADKNEIIKKNMGILKSLEIKDETLKRYYAILLDEELENKIKFFRDELLKSARDIELNFEVLLVYTYEDLIALQTACKEYELDLSMIPLALLRQGLASFFANLEYLTSRGTELDRGEVAKFSASIFANPDHFKNNCEMVNKYQYGLTKKNGKTAIQVMAQDSTMLAVGLDAVIETGEEKLFETSPEKMSMDLISIANIIAYCKQSGVPIYAENGTPHKFLFDEEEFTRIFTGIDPETLKAIPTMQEASENISEVLNYSPLIEVLGSMDLESIYLDGGNAVDQDIYFELIDYGKTVAAQAESTDRTYIIDGVVISKERFERNLQFLLSKKIVAPSEELLTASLLYGSLKDKEEMKRVADKMGFNAPTVGGVQL